MTRLVKKDIEMISQELFDYDSGLKSKTGLSLRQIASVAAGISEAEFTDRLSTCLAAVIPITAGEGVIEGFAQSVCDIITFLGCRGIVTDNTDVSGIAEAVNAGADLLFMADEEQFVSINLHARAVIDNGEATGRGYIAALNGMAEGLKRKPVLVLGAGPVGRGALNMLRQLGSQPAVYDPNPIRARQAAGMAGAVMEESLPEALSKYLYIVDATPQPALIEYGRLQPGAMMALPGIPLGLTEQDYNALQKRAVHDPLQIGVATMLAMAIAR